MMKKIILLTLILFLAVNCMGDSRVELTEVSYATSSQVEVTVMETFHTVVFTTTSTSTSSTSSISSESISSSQTSGLTYVTRNPTTTLYCGNDPDVCYVEYDFTGEGKSECCTIENHEVCGECLEQCNRICKIRGEYVKFCFGGTTILSCDCVPLDEPECPQTTTTSTTQPGDELKVLESSMKDRNIYYLVMAVIMMLVLAGIVYYVRGL